MGKSENTAYLEKVFSNIPPDFRGSLLEVPVGTGILTMPVYQKLKDAEIICLDYSSEMMARAQNRAVDGEIENVRFLQGDVGALPFEDESFDIVLSLNGFHAFPDKDAAYRETYRVLKKGGMFCGCFYAKGEVARTDWFISAIYTPKGFFTPPYETRESLTSRLLSMYRTAKVETAKSMACFTAVK